MDPVAPSAHFGPVSRYERNTTIDVIRGLAIFGVLWVNLLTEFRISLFEHILVFHTHTGFLNEWIDLVTAWLIEFKAFTVLSLLFGVGIGIQVDRIAAQGISAPRFLVRRDSILLLIGLCHMFLVWDGDILCLYACCGLLAVPLLRLPPAGLIYCGLVLIVITFMPIAGIFIPSDAAMRAQVAISTPIYSTGSFRAILELRSQEAVRFIAPLLVNALPKTLGLILIGVASWRLGVWRDRVGHRRFWVGTFVVGTLIGALMTSLIFWAAVAGKSLPWPSAISDGLSYIPLGLGLTAGVALCLAYQVSGRVTGFLAAIGQLALTNYLAQSVIFSLIFYGVSSKGVRLPYVKRSRRGSRALHG